MRLVIARCSVDYSGLRRDPLLREVTGVLAAQQITPQARVLAGERGIRCVVLDYDALRGLEPDVPTLF